MHSFILPRQIRRWSAFALLALAAASARSDIATYYISVDNLPAFTSGTYNGLPNPNYNRLTFQYAHTYAATPANNHYHSKGRYQLSNAPPNVVTNVNASNYVPEGSLPPLVLADGAGVFAGKKVLVPLADTNDASYVFSKLEIRNTLDLTGFLAGTPQHYLYGSSAGRWTNMLNGSDVHLVLVSLSEGLHVGTTNALNIGLNAPGDEYHLGDGAEPLSFTPVLWTEQNAPPGPHRAVFKLDDENGVFGESGPFEFRLDLAPPPLLAQLSASGPEEGSPTAGIEHTATSQVYQLWISTNLMEGIWLPHGTALPGTGSNLWFGLPTNAEPVFLQYRVGNPL